MRTQRPNWAFYTTSYQPRRPPCRVTYLCHDNPSSDILTILYILQACERRARHSQSCRQNQRQSSCQQGMECISKGWNVWTANQSSCLDCSMYLVLLMLLMLPLLLVLLLLL